MRQNSHSEYSRTLGIRRIFQSLAHERQIFTSLIIKKLLRGNCLGENMQKHGKTFLGIIPGENENLQLFFLLFMSLWIKNLTSKSVYHVQLV